MDNDREIDEYLGDSIEALMGRDATGLTGSNASRPGNRKMNWDRVARDKLMSKGAVKADPFDGRRELSPEEYRASLKALRKRD